MGLSIAWCPSAELETYVKNYAETIAANAPLTVKAVKYIVGEAMKDESQARPGALRRDGRAMLRQQGLHRRPPRLHGEAQAGIYRQLRPWRQAVADANRRFGASIVETTAVKEPGVEEDWRGVG